MQMNDCLFCKIIRGEIQAKRVFENEKVVGFLDIHPLAKVHVLFIHKYHTANMNELTRHHPEQLVELFSAVAEYSQEHNLEQSGVRLVINIGRDAGQSVFHTHIHLLSGERLGQFGA